MSQLFKYRLTNFHDMHVIFKFLSTFTTQVQFLDLSTIVAVQTRGQAMGTGRARILPLCVIVDDKKEYKNKRK